MLNENKNLTNDKNESAQLTRSARGANTEWLNMNDIGHQVSQCSVLFSDQSVTVVAIAAPKPFVKWVINVNCVRV